MAEVNHWWLSYADEEDFRGAIISTGYSFSDAAKNAKISGASPGGQVVGVKLDPRDVAHIPNQLIGVLMPKEWVLALEQYMNIKEMLDG